MTSAMRRAKIVCTIGPASCEPAMLDRLIEAGMNVARLNFSHGTQAGHAGTLEAVRAAADRRRTAVAILQDLQGPRIRLGVLPEGGVELVAGQRVRLMGGILRSGGQHGAQTVLGSEMLELPVTYPQLARDVRPGARILIDDGRIELLASSVWGGAVECRVKTGGCVTSQKGMNLPGTVVSAPTLTEKDRDDIRFGIAHQVDYLALSFVRGSEDIRVAREFVRSCGGEQPIIAKIERAEAIESLGDILDSSDGVMIARGDLGVEMGPEAVPVLQKRIMAEANRRRRVVITATQMLESMMSQPVPTRAEASDVANAIFDGTDAVMLSGETARGRYPVETVQVMDRIVRAAEAERRLTGTATHPRGQTETIAEAMCSAAASAAETTGAVALAVMTESGTTARLLSKHQPAAPIIAFTPNETTRRRMALYWGVEPRVMQWLNPDEQVTEIERRFTSERSGRSGDRIVLLAGTVAGRPGGTNVMKLHTIQ